MTYEEACKKAKELKQQAKAIKHAAIVEEKGACQGFDGHFDSGSFHVGLLLGGWGMFAAITMIWVVTH